MKPMKTRECPMCGEEISLLMNYQSGEKVFRFDGDDYEEYEFIADDGTNDYVCPGCNMTLFTSEDAAREFLKGK